MPDRGWQGLAKGGHPLSLGRPGEIIRAGTACICQHSNLAPMMPVRGTLVLTTLGRFHRKGFLLPRSNTRAAKTLTAVLKIQPAQIVGRPVSLRPASGVTRAELEAEIGADA